MDAATTLAFGPGSVPVSVLDLAPVPDGGNAGPGALSFLRLRAGRPGPLPSPEEAAAYPYNEPERAFVRDRQATQIIGSPETVRRGLAGLLEATAADELMLTTMVFDPPDRLRSFELVAALASAPQPLDAPDAGSPPPRRTHVRP